MRSAKQQTKCYEKLMKAIAKDAKKNDISRRLFGKYTAGENTVWLCNGCVVFGIPYAEYEKLYEVCGCPSIEDCAESSMDLKKIITDIVVSPDATECKMTTMAFYNGNGALLNVYSTGKTYGTGNKKEFGTINSIYRDMIDYMPVCVSGYNPKALNRKSPIVFYDDMSELGYAICPVNFDVVQALSNLGFEQN